MPWSPSTPRFSGSTQSRGSLVCLTACLAILGLSLLAPYNHDETQYYAANQAVSFASPYRDFIYLQAPLGLYLGQAVMAISPGFALLTGRMLQALMGFGIFVLVWRTNTSLIGDRKTALGAAALMACCSPFLFCVTVYRNDVLPALLYVLAITLLVHAAKDVQLIRARSLVIPGMLITAAASAKINYGLVGLAPALWLATLPDTNWRSKAACLGGLASGALLGLVPLLVHLTRDAPAVFLQIITYHAEATTYWLGLTGRADRLTLVGRTADILEILLQGAMLPALLIIGVQHWRGREDLEARGRHRQVKRVLDLLIVFSMAAAIIPQPSYKQYFLVLLPALFVRLPLALIELPQGGRKLGWLCVGVPTAASIIGMAVQVGQSLAHPDRQIITHWRESRWIGDKLRENRVTGRLASLSPHLAVDSGYRPDLRFVSGPFFFRWNDPQHAAEIEEVGGVTSHNLSQKLASAPPSAIVTGYETGQGTVHRVDLDEPLRAFAERHGYTAIRSPHGQAVLHLRLGSASPP